MSFRHAFFALLLLLLSVSPAAAQGVSADKAKGCVKTIARFLDSDICAADIEPDSASLQAMRAALGGQGQDPEAEIKRQNAGKLRDVIWTRALDHKFGAQSYAPTPEEIANYRRDFQAFKKRNHENGKKTGDLIKELLAKNRYSPENEAELRGILESSEHIEKFYDEREKHRASMPPEFQQMVDETEDEIAAAVVRDWKIDKLLHETYGGRVAIGPALQAMPIDAYKAFIDYIKKDGRLVILDADYRHVFKGLEEKMAADWQFLSDGPSTQYYKQPRWQFPGGMGIDYESMSRILTELPTLDEAVKE